MEHSRTRSHNDQKYDGNSWIQCSRNNGEKSCLADGADEGENDAKEVEFSCLRAYEGQSASEEYDERVKSSIGPASNGVDWGVFPRLEAVAMVEVMCWLPIVEDFVAVLYGREKGGEQTGC